MRTKSWILAFVTTLMLAPSAALAYSGRVLDAATGAPLAGAIVTLGSEVVTTDDGGRYRLNGNGGVVGARAPGYRRSEIGAQDAKGEELPPLLLAPFRPKGLYLSFWGIGDRGLREGALEVASAGGLNTLVIDVKGDRGWIPYPTKVAKAEAVGARRHTTVRDMAGMVARLKERGLYLIARIVVFKDDPLATSHPEWAVRTTKGEPFRDREKLAWVDASRPEVWAYNLDIAAEAAELGFDEIQFDYVRFPDAGGLVLSVPNTEAQRVAAISGFLAAAKKRLAPYNVFVSADIFGYVLWNRNDTSIGQELRSVAGQVDYVAPMLYPSGFHLGIPRYTNPVANPYEIVYLTLKNGAERAGLPPVRFRPWLQAFRDYAFDRRTFGEHEVRRQIDAADTFGANGWMLWNPNNRYSSEGLKKR